MKKSVSALTLGLLILLFGSFSSAQQAKADTPVCTLGGLLSCSPEQVNSNPQCACITTNGAVLGAASTRPPGTNGANVYGAAGIPVNQLGAPIDAWGVCRFVDNGGATSFPPGGGPTAVPKSRTSRRYSQASQDVAALISQSSSTTTSAFYVSFTTETQWINFIAANSNPLATIYAVPCARPAPIDTGALTDATSDNFKNVPVVVDVPGYGHPVIPGRVNTNPATTFNTTKTYNHTRQDCNSVNQCNGQNWTQIFTVNCTAVIDAPNNIASKDAGKWSCVVVNNNNPVPPFNPPPPPSCNGNSSGSIYFVFDTTISRPANLTECPFGPGTRQFLEDREKQVQCQAGTEVATGVTRLVNPRFTGVCAPQPVPTCIFRDNTNNDVVRNASECCVVPGNLNICGNQATGTPTTLGTNQTLSLTGGFSRQENYACLQVATSNSQAVYSFISTTQSGLCQPLACGPNASGTTYWVNTGNSSSNRAATSAECPAGGTVTTTVTNQAEFQCFNGTQTATGNTRQINPMNQIQCNPQSCGSNPSGSVYWVAAGNETQNIGATGEQCPAGFGGTVNRTTFYENEYLCNNGTQTVTGNQRISNILFSNLICNGPPACGSNPSGSVYWIASGSQTDSVDASLEQCPAGYGGTVNRTTFFEAEYQCNAGSQNATGNSRVSGVTFNNLLCMDPPPVFNDGDGGGSGGDGGGGGGGGGAGI